MNATLVLGWGNPSRGDDALGPMFVERLDALRPPGVACLTDFQLQVEHALDLRGCERVLFVDASMRLGSGEPFKARPLAAHRDPSFTTHALSPEAVLQAFEDFEGRPAPSAWLLEIGGERWALGDAPSETAVAHLEAALAWCIDWLQDA